MMVITSALALSLNAGAVRGVGRASSPLRTTGRLLAVAAATGNPLLVQSGLPKFDAIVAADVKPAMEAVLSDLESGFEALEKKCQSEGTLSYAEVMESMEQVEAPLEFAWGVVGHLMGVANSDELRAAHSEMQPKVVQVTTKLGQSVPVFTAVGALASGAAGELDATQRRIIDQSLTGMKLSGVGLSGEAKEKFNANRLALAEASTAFSNNLLDATKAFKLTLTDKADLAGLPPSALDLAAQRAATDGHEGATADAGPWQLGLDMPSYLPAMKFAKKRSVREQLYRAFVTRAGETNAPLIDKILTLRREQAQLLGFATHADVSLTRKMAGSVEAVAELTEMLRAKALPAAKQELADLTAFAKANGFVDETLSLWDVPFWSERQSESKFGFEEEELRPYFALPNVLDGLFSLCARMFDVRIVESAEPVSKWHPDVKYFDVLDGQTGAPLANFYLDPYARPETKRGGAWMDSLYGRSKVLGRKPVAYLTCNGSPPTGDKPALMTFSEVTTLFHETGHGLQHMLTAVERAPAAGINGVEWDAVELPSQFMENWCYDEKTVYDSGLARHYETGEPLPRDLFAKLCAQKTYQAGMGMLRQLFFGALDMQLHSSYDPTAAGDSPFALQHRMAADFTALPPLPEDRFLCGFSHIFAGGYAAGYYSYKWAEVLSADAFAAFEEAGLDDEEAVQAVGRRFRATVLSLGGSAHPSEVFRAFRGRDPSPEPLLRHSGLA